MILNFDTFLNPFDSNPRIDSGICDDSSKTRTRLKITKFNSYGQKCCAPITYAMYGCVHVQVGVNACGERESIQPLI